ncbi:hypothetical protein XBLMG947_0504 [Xanthomonas bromi]|uniref:Uncharacterized protein n=1 Tax=Xanthomonas bromi TaxID=56449 RepID=A0A1C3NH54_9XANT|nr:hypothetical protein XBLMG947_0504 [Xanthomonas bromi]
MHPLMRFDGGIHANSSAIGAHTASDSLLAVLSKPIHCRISAGLCSHHADLRLYD